MLASACVVGEPARAVAQMGQSAMAPAGGIGGQALTRLRELDSAGPGWLYWGVNAADRGLGYRGSYITLGGYIPYSEDDLGGLWAADVRTHLSNYGGFFSNVGAVRKQFIGGSLFGIGVYWDYDGDQNQYGDTTISDISGNYVFAGGQTYQQVGVSAEWLTDWGNLRSNGYIPCGTTGQIMGPLVGNSLLCRNGINAALTGTDLEIGAYVPGLSDWAGMVSVGGYAYGNNRYTQVGQGAAVPWFGGVYTRLDLTLRKNWDFSLQANNDSYFDWTGFARLTYRMGGSRRRNVPDQMEQPMMRNEHIVRAHQAPEQAINPVTGTPWFVIHVDNTVSTAAGGAGTYENPYHTLDQGQANATNPFDVVFVHVGRSQTTPYATPLGGFQFQADNQFLVGEGTSLRLQTQNCGQVLLWAKGTSPVYPVIRNVSTDPNAAAIVLNRDRGTVDHLRITGSPIGIADGNGLKTGDVVTVRDVQVVGNGPGQRGVQISGIGTGTTTADATFNFSSLSLAGLTRDGFVVSSAAGGNPTVNLSNSQIADTTGSGVIVQSVSDTGRVKVSETAITRSSQYGVFVGNGNAIVISSTIRNSGIAAVYVQDGDPSIATPPPAGTSNVQVAESVLFANPVGIWGSATNGTTNLTATQNRIVQTVPPTGANGIYVSLDRTTGTAVVNAALVGNQIIPGITTTTGSTGGGAVSSLANILLTYNGAGAATDGLNIKASDTVGLQTLNYNAGAITVVDGVAGAAAPPPTFNPALVVPLPPP